MRGGAQGMTFFVITIMIKTVIINTQYFQSCPDRLNILPMS